MGKVFSSIKHPLKNFNLEDRAHKIISQSKPIVAPKHKKDEMHYERMLKEYPQELEDSLKKNPLLDKNLKDIFVTSHDPDKDVIQEHNPDRPLPTDRKQVQSFLYGVKVPDKIPLGKVTLGNALEFITQHQGNPKTFNAKYISENHHLEENVVENILKYFRVFEVYVPQERETKANFAGPSIPKVQIVKKIRKALPQPKDSDEKT